MSFCVMSDRGMKDAYILVTKAQINLKIIETCLKVLKDFSEENEIRKKYEKLKYQLDDVQMTLEYILAQ